MKKNNFIKFLILCLLILNFQACAAQENNSERMFFKGKEVESRNAQKKFQQRSRKYDLNGDGTAFFCPTRRTIKKEKRMKTLLKKPLRLEKKIKQSFLTIGGRKILGDITSSVNDVSKISKKISNISLENRHMKTNYTREPSPISPDLFDDKSPDKNNAYHFLKDIFSTYRESNNNAMEDESRETFQRSPDLFENTSFHDNSMLNNELSSQDTSCSLGSPDFSQENDDHQDDNDEVIVYGNQQANPHLYFPR
jgi:hypothetical protein